MTDHLTLFLACFSVFFSLGFSRKNEEYFYISLLEKAEIPTEFRDGIIFVSSRDGIGDGKRH